jgi:hypothetical protein
VSVAGGVGVVVLAVGCVVVGPKPVVDTAAVDGPAAVDGADVDTASVVAGGPERDEAQADTTTTNVSTSAQARARLRTPERLTSAACLIAMTARPYPKQRGPDRRLET